MKVSVCITTYNHRPFIAQALDSVLSQQTDFAFEILVGEDDSSDGTRQIVEEYSAMYPDRIRLFLHDRKDVLYIDGRPTGRRNFVHNIEHAQGDYIALLDGDDYWTDSLKLQKQADFLDSHFDSTLCFHAAQSFNMEHPAKDYVLRPADRRPFYSLQDLLRENIVPSCAVMFRRGLFGPFPDWFFKASTGDWPLHVLNAMHGNLGYLDEVMAVYRVHSGGVWMGWPLANRLRGIINSCQVVAENLQGEERKILERKVFVVSLELAHELLRLGDKESAFDALKQHRFPVAILSGCLFRYLRLLIATSAALPQQERL